MDYLNLLLQTAPSGFWQNIILGLEVFVKDYGLTLVLLTLIIKLLMSPLDLYNKVITLYNSRKQAKLKPALDKLQATYGSNQAMLNQKTQELYKREGFSIGGVCLGMLGTLLLSSIVFITLFRGLTSIANYKQVEEYKTLSNVYYSQVVETNENKNFGYDFSIENENGLKDYVSKLEEMTEEQKSIFKTEAETAVIDEYENVRASFLWIKNIWKQDTTTNAVSNYKDFSKVAGSLVKTDNENYISEAEYNTVMNAVKQEYGGPNGLFLLAVISIITSYFSIKIPTLISARKAKKQGKVVPEQVAGKSMQFIMPIIFGIFTFFYNAAFGIYIVTGALVSLAVSPLITIIAENIDDKRVKKEEGKNKVSYSRK